MGLNEARAITNAYNRVRFGAAKLSGSERKQIEVLLSQKRFAEGRALLKPMSASALDQREPLYLAIRLEMLANQFAQAKLMIDVVLQHLFVSF